ncbi:MAG: serine hydrolase [Dehalococcoidia bacterium]
MTLAVAIVALAGSLVFLARAVRSEDAPARAAVAELPAASATGGQDEATPTRAPSPPRPTAAPARTVPARTAPAGADATPGLPPREDAALVAAVEEALKPFEGVYSVAVYRLSDGKAAAIEPDRVFYAASLFKLAVLYEAGLRLDSGDLDLEAALAINDIDIAEDDGTFDSVPRRNDGSISVAMALEAMVTVSDTTTANAFLHLFGHATIDATMHSLGLQHTSVNTRELPTTASDMAILMTAIYNGRGLTPATRDYLRSLLLAQHLREGIPAGLPGGVAVGNKTGNVADDTHDVAFVEAPGGAYVLAVLSDRSWNWSAHVAVSEAVYRALAAPVR